MYLLNFDFEFYNEKTLTVSFSTIARSSSVASIFNLLKDISGILYKNGVCTSGPA